MASHTHQDVSLQQQPWLYSDADAGLAVSWDVAKGESWAEKKEPLGAGQEKGNPPCCPLLQSYWETSLALYFHPLAWVLTLALGCPRPSFPWPTY